MSTNPIRRPNLSSLRGLFEDFTGMPESLMQRLFYIPITAEFLSDGERERFAEFVGNV